MKTIIVSIIGILLLGFSVIYFSEGGGMRIGRRAAEIKRHSDALAALNTKIQRYVLDHPALETEGFARKTIQDLVAMGILSPEDEVYIRDHAIKFHGYDADASEPVPVFEEALKTKLNQKLLRVYTEGSGRRANSY
jgi:hypothetical protein